MNNFLSIGISAIFCIVFISLLFSDQASLYFDLSSLVIVLGGTIAIAFFSFPIKDIKQALRSLQTLYYKTDSSSHVQLNKILQLAKRAKEQGLLSLENNIYKESDPFLKKSIQLLVDGFSAEEIQRNLEIELNQAQEKLKKEHQFFYSIGTIAPSMGLIGTLIGLVQMLRNLQDPSQLGNGMATALLTTFYGALLAYVVFIPLAWKIKAKNEETLSLKEMTLEGILEISKATNPKLIEHKLLAYLPEDLRINLYQQ